MSDFLSAQGDHGIMTSIANDEKTQSAKVSSMSNRIVGLAIFAILPAVFWTTVIAAVSPVMFGVGLDAGAVATIGIGIAAFLTPLYGAFAVGE